MYTSMVLHTLLQSTERLISDSPTRWDAIGWEQRRNISEDSSSLECINLARLWVEECVESHKSCRVESPLLPTRVVHVGSDDSEPRVFLSNGQSARYTTLSHSWGDYHPLSVTNKALESWEERIPFVDLPKSFQDAIIITRALGIEYLWIDCLCILQDDLNDWESEASRMADVYSHSYVNISADDAKDAREGFLCPRDERAYRAIRIPCPGTQDGETGFAYARLRGVPVGDTWSNFKIFPTIITAVAHTTEGTHPKNVLDTRGWTLQERLLSPRTLHYTAAELVFECREHLRCECSLKQGKDEAYDKWRLFKNQHAEGDDAPRFDWNHIIEDFTSRDLKFDTDRLPAIAGLAKAMEPYPVSDYLCGLWRQDLKMNLLWARASLTQSKRIQGHYAPTWSWASVHARILYISTVPWWGEDDGEWAEVINVDVVPTTSNPYGPGKGSITLRGPIGPATVESLEVNSSVMCLENSQGKKPKLPLSADVTEPYEVAADENVFLFVNTHLYVEEYHHWDVECTVLKLVDATTSPETYRRVGLASRYSFGFDVAHWDGFTVKNVRII
jgi:Heterokaryon incompatibility protein (HET)